MFPDIREKDKLRLIFLLLPGVLSVYEKSLFF